MPGHERDTGAESRRRLYRGAEIASAVQRPPRRARRFFVWRVQTKLALKRFFSSPQQSEETKMDWNRVEGNWKQFKGKVKEQWGKLTDDDLDRIAGKRDQLEGTIQQRYGIERDRAHADVDEWCNRQTWN
jgi:uncharacterized protein YjbJ (UPF0337 family)